VDAPHPPWLICADTGGTFTDCVAFAPDGSIRRAKVLSHGALRVRCTARTSARELLLADAPEGFDLVGLALAASTGGRARRIVAHEGARVTLDAPLADAAPGALLDLSTGEPAPVLAARLATGTPATRPLPPAQLRLATTRGTNALLERRLTPAALFVTRGFADLIRIGDQRRPDLFALDIDAHPARDRAWAAATIEVDERVDARGAVRRPLDPSSLGADADALLARGVRSAAICLLHSWINPDHETALERWLLSRGFVHVSRSSALAPRIGVLARCTTALVNAALSGPVHEFVSETAGAWGSGSRVMVMTSAAGLSPARRFAPKDALLSGPAGGVLGAAHVACDLGLRRLLTFDMGGTSTDVARIDEAPSGRLDLVDRHRVGAAELLAPAVNVHSVAAGGGSVCAFDPVLCAVTVGPRSAGAAPGPACYGGGGPLTVTDVNLLTGRLLAHRFHIAIDEAPARARLAELRRAMGASAPTDEDLLVSLLAIANDHMAAAIRRVSVAEGYDPSGAALVAFGGAGPQHACAVADELGIRTVVVPADCGLLSAVGLAGATLERSATRQVLAQLDCAGLGRVAAELEGEARSQLVADGAPEASLRVARRTVRLRYAGQQHTIDLDLAEGPSLRASFEEASRRVFGHAIPGRAIEVESATVSCVADEPRRSIPPPDRGPGVAPEDEGVALFRSGRLHTRVIERSSLTPDGALAGPALVVERLTTTVVEPGWSARMHGSGALILTRDLDAARARPPAAARDELLAGALNSLAEQMGERLRLTALSTNVKERLDFSCALLDGSARLIVSAPHVPVHLGALGLCVRALLERHPLSAGDVLVTNHPAFGGSHLPDVTVVAPAFDDAGTLLGYAACRAHHAEIGGSRPGSMPPDARTLADEGVVIPPTYLARAGRPDWSAVEHALRSAPHPTRAPEENLADLAAQVASIRRGVDGLRDLARAWSTGALAHAMSRLHDQASASIRAALPSVRPARVSEALDDGRTLRVRIGPGAGDLTVDLTGSPGVHPGNLNAPLAVVHSAVMYALRLLLGPAWARAGIPLNDGLLAPVRIVVPPGMLNPPFDADPARCPAVAAGNVETSQRLVNALVRALGLAADSQGTMNNLVFGNERFGYYETIAGGAGAGPAFDGASAVHTHMTNTAITDPEILEHRYPVRLERFQVRAGSGGDGAHRGGDGVVRELTFLEPVSLSLLTQHRDAGPSGLGGGQPGLPGRQRMVRADGSTLDLPHAATADLGAGDRLIVETPGGGGFGAPG